MCTLNTASGSLNMPTMLGFNGVSKLQKWPEQSHSKSRNGAWEHNYRIRYAFMQAWIIEHAIIHDASIP